MITRATALFIALGMLGTACSTNEPSDDAAESTTPSTVEAAAEPDASSGTAADEALDDEIVDDDEVTVVDVQVSTPPDPPQREEVGGEEIAVESERNVAEPELTLDESGALACAHVERVLDHLIEEDQSAANASLAKAVDAAVASESAAVTAIADVGDEATADANTVETLLDVCYQAGYLF